MTGAIRIREHGGPEVLEWSTHELPSPGPGEVRVRHTAIGVNFIDVYFRTGLYPAPAMPFTPGMEGAGTVTEVGEGVSEVARGDRVAYAATPPGAYARERLIAADRLVPLPDSIDESRAAAMMLKGLTAQYLLRRCYAVRPGETILVQAAAGGVGLLLCQWARHLGARVLGTVGSREKAELARRHGCDHTILYREENLVERVAELTSGKGVAVVYDSVGRDTFMASLDCLRPLGTMVSFGQSSGAIEPLDVGVLARKGSLYLTRPTLFTYIDKRQDLLNAASELFDLVERGIINIEIGQRFPLRKADQAHRALEGRQTTGSTLLIP
jgi:NADPH2:quinone reductase